MSLKSGMQLFNLGLSIMNKMQMMQHRQTKMMSSQERRPSHLGRPTKNYLPEPLEDIKNIKI